ncbi:hypothetical protein [Aquimarina sp. 2201CG5-10]|uniref:hypothetical protein n=1 Tax=Aquimarina callyspongiae TaxID=3098150 RepID=UPI002AB36C81|nr:hypothetical protein [Aquimarina sp. 2201CG5-10]MDY8136757.1 hypothetical protein [Aquimarina sp. 2201CG5-10]
MKSILNLEGAKKISKTEQTNILGGAGFNGCYEEGSRCCEHTGGPRGVFCDAGYCTRWGCVWH